MRKGLFLTLASSLLVLSCKKKPEDPPAQDPVDQYIRIDVNPKFGSDILYLDSVYSFQNGDLIKFNEIKFYFENPRNGSTQMVDAALFDYKLRGTKLLEVIGDYTKFTSLQANLGVDSAINHNDPSAFPNNSMLNIMNSNDMHWGWNPGYIFIKVEAKADTIPDATELFDHTIVYHIGLDAYLQELSYTNLNWIATSSTKHQLNFSLDMEAFFNGPFPIDIQTEYTSHSAMGQEALTAKVAANFKSALSPL